MWCHHESILLLKQAQKVKGSTKQRSKFSFCVRGSPANRQNSTSIGWSSQAFHTEAFFIYKSMPIEEESRMICLTYVCWEDLGAAEGNLSLHWDMWSAKAAVRHQPGCSAGVSPVCLPANALVVTLFWFKTSAISHNTESNLSPAGVRQMCFHAQSMYNDLNSCHSSNL